MNVDMDSIKADAKLIKECSDLGHCQSLEVAARKAGFRTYTEAKALLGRPSFKRGKRP